MIQLTQNETNITLHDNLTLTPDVQTVIDAYLKYQIETPICIYPSKRTGKPSITRVAADKQAVYKETIKSIPIPIGDKTATLYPVGGYAIKDITDEMIADCKAYLTCSIFVDIDHNGKPFIDG